MKILQEHLRHVDLENHKLYINSTRLKRNWTKLQGMSAKNIQLGNNWMAGHELVCGVPFHCRMRVMWVLVVVGKLLLLNPVMWDFMLLYLLPDGRCEKKAWQGWYRSLMIDAAFLRQHLLSMLSMEGRAVLVTDWAESIFLCSFQ